MSEEILETTVINPILQEGVPFCSGENCPRWSKANLCWALGKGVICQPAVIQINQACEKFKRIASEQQKRAEGEAKSANNLAGNLVRAVEKLTLLEVKFKNRGNLMDFYLKALQKIAYHDMDGKQCAKVARTALGTMPAKITES
jgi:hypothetical protein